MQVVLEGCPGQEKSVVGVQLAQLLGDLTLFVLDLVGLINDQILPLKLH